MENREEHSGGSEGDDSDLEASFVPRERTFTLGSLTDLGKKRKQETVTEECCNDPNPEEEKEPKQKRVKPTSKLKRFSQSFQRLSFRMDMRAAPLPTRPWVRVSRGPSKSREGKLWSETFDNVKEELSVTEVRRQEAIFELTQGEQSLIDDLNITKKAYFDPMLKLCIMSEEELNQIFGSLYSLIPLHEDLLNRLQQVRKDDGTVSEVGCTLIEWFPLLQAYEKYCCNLIAAKSLLDYKKQEQRVTEFLTLCQESSFSRKLDLWNFLDLPRSRLFKYPLLLREIARYTPAQHPDQERLGTAIELIQGIVARVNLKTGEAECHYYRERLLYLDPSQKQPLIDRSTVLCCHGELKNNKGAKLQVFLFDRVLVVTRMVCRNNLPLFQVYRTPIPLRQLVLEDLPDGETRLGVSFRGAFGNSTERAARNVFRVSFRDRTRGQSHTFQANDAFNKHQWISCIRQAVVNCHDNSEARGPGPGISDSALRQIAELRLDGADDMQQARSEKRLAP